MAQAAVAIENNFKQGFVTEFTGLNFPENGCTETYDCVFGVNGAVTRRLGFDFESGFIEKTIDRDDVAISTFLWKNVSGDGNVTLFVTQVGGTIYFYETDEVSVSAGAVLSNITLSTFLASGAPSPDLLECQFSSGSKYLIVTHPYCDPFRVSYNAATQTITGTLITLKIRDFEGDSADSLAVDGRPSTTLAAMDIHHYYNLLNQGWSVTNLTAWDTGKTDMPSNSDVMWRFKDSSDAFAVSTVPNVISGNSPAPKGHYILTLANQNRDTASGLSGTTSQTTSYQRPSTSAWFSGRVFYAGLNYAGFNGSLYFTQIIERDEQYGFAYQSNDPTSEDLFDLLPSDGGVIKIPEAGTIIKLVTMNSALVVFANNGIWSIEGSTGLGFKADDYTVQKLSTINAISASSFVDVGGVPLWWNADGIYTISGGENGGLSVKSLTLTTIKKFYDDIPLVNKKNAKGFFNVVTGIVQWLYRDQDFGTLTESYSYDHILNFNTLTGAFYPWVIPDSDISINSVVVLDGVTGATTLNDIVDDSGNLIIDDSANQITAIENSSQSSNSAPVFKYFVSYPDGDTYKFTMASTSNTDHIDWSSYDGVGTTFSSYFITGFKVRGKALTKFQTTWVNIYSETAEAVKYHFQGIWDYALTGSGTGRWSSNAYVAHTDTNYSNTARRLKIRGRGKVLQFRVESVENSPFNLIGWSTLDTGSERP